MTFYPEFMDGKMTEMWHADKWVKDADEDVLTPIFRLDNIVYYVNELVRLSYQSFFIPKRWVKHGKNMQAVGYHVDNDGVCIRHQDNALRLTFVSGIIFYSKASKNRG